MRIPFKLSLGLGVIASAFLSACGGGGGGLGDGLPDATTAPVVLKVDKTAVAAVAGKSFVVKGTATSQPAAMTAMSWNVTKLTAGAPDLVLINGDCANGTRAGNSVNGITRSQWGCDAVFTVPAILGIDSTYRLTFTGADAKGNSSSDYRDVTITSSGSPLATAPPLVTTQPSLAGVSGDGIEMTCLGSGGSLAAGANYVYSWVVKSNPTGLPLTLKAEGDGRLSFKVPLVKTASNITFQCRVLDSVLNLGTSDTVVTVTPNTMIAGFASAGPTQSVGQNTAVNLDASASTSPTGAALYYLWQQTEGPMVTLSDAMSVKPSFVAPVVAETTRLTFKVTALQTTPVNPLLATPSESATVSVYVTPEAPLVLSITSATVVKTSTGVTIQVAVSPSGGTFYYAWSQVSGPSVTLGGANTSAASFVSPDIAGAYVDQVFSVSVSRKPLNLAKPAEIYTTDVVVRTAP